MPDAINPQSGVYLAWLCLMSLSFLYNAYAIPLRMSFPYQTRENFHLWLIADYSTDFLFIVDMLVVKPRRMFIRQGLAIVSSVYSLLYGTLTWLQRERNAMRRRYLFSLELKLDILSLLPLEIGYFWLGPSAWLRFPRLLRINAFFSCFAQLDVVVKNAVVLRIGKTLSYMIYVIHLNACLHYAISAAQVFGELGLIESPVVGPPVSGGTNFWTPNRWVYNNEGNAYVRCFYFATKLAISIGNNPMPTNMFECIQVRM